MKSTFLVACMTATLIALPLVAAAHGPEAHPKSVQTPNEDIKPFVSVVEQFSSALKSGDLKLAGSLLTDDVLVLQGGGAEHSREEYLGGHAAHDAAFLKDAHIQITQRRARSSGDLAWVGTESEVHASKDGKPLTLRSTETMVLRRDAGTWRIVHIHWSSRPVKAGADPQS